MNTILMTEEYWANTQLSIVRRTGVIKYNGVEFIIVNKEGKDIFECSFEADKAGREKAIEPGEPVDLVRTDFQKLYRALGRDSFIKILEQCNGKTPEIIKKIMRKKIKEGSN